MRKFKRVYIEIINMCNLTCHFCPQTKRTNKIMDLDLFNLILTEIKPYTDYIYLHVKGEPLLHPKLSEFLDLANELGFKVNITTNGTLINKAREQLIGKQAIRQINISLHSLSANNIEDKTAYLNSIIDFTKEISNYHNIYISLRLWNLSTDNSFNLLQKRNQELLSIIEKEFNLSFKIEEKITFDRGIKIANNVFLHQDHEFKWPDINEIELGEVGFCLGLRDHLAILVDGTVIPCCLDGEGVINLGNIKNIRFTDIINSERANNIYNGFSNRKAVEELCKRCGYRSKMDLK